MSYIYIVFFVSYDISKCQVSSNGTAKMKLCHSCIVLLFLYFREFVKNLFGSKSIFITKMITFNPKRDKEISQPSLSRINFFPWLFLRPVKRLCCWIMNTYFPAMMKIHLNLDQYTQCWFRGSAYWVVTYFGKG